MNEMIQIDFEAIQCVSCGCIFKVPTTLQKTLKENKKTFYCPNGHPQSYTNSTADILREQLEAKNRKIAEQNETIEARGRYIDGLNMTINKLERKVKRGKAVKK